MTDSSWTVLWILVAVVGLVGWDIYVAFYNNVPNMRDTISGKILTWSRTPFGNLLIFSFGVLMGHFFWPQVVDSVCP